VLEPVRRQRIGWKVSAIAEIAQLKFIGVFFSCWPARRRHRRRFLFSFYFLSACLRIHYSGFALRILTAAVATNYVLIETIQLDNDVEMQTGERWRRVFRPFHRSRPRLAFVSHGRYPELL
jgi:uncharacterized metal-binding protein